MILYKKICRLIGVFYGGQGFREETRILTDWYDEDDPAFKIKSKEVKTEYDYFHEILKQEKYIKIKA